MYLLERGPKDLEALTTWAQKHLIAHKQRSLQCYHCQGFGHRQSECGAKISPGKDQKGSSTPVSQSSQKKTRAMVAQLDEDGEKAFKCVKVEGARSKSNLKKSGTEGSTNSDKAVHIQMCISDNAHFTHSKNFDNIIEKLQQPPDYL